MIYYLYQITNLVNNKIYVGVHKTKNLNDGYMGSGKVIKAAIQKYGLDNFRKDVLEFFESSEAMYAREKEIVTDEFLLREDTYNLRRGGTGGFDYINTNGLDYKNYQSRAEKNRAFTPLKEYNKNPEFRAKIAQAIRDKKSWKSGIDAIKKRVDEQGGTFTGKKHTAATKEKMKLAKAGKVSGKQNSQYGTMWITNGCEVKKINQTEPIPLGWKRGRKLH